MKGRLGFTLIELLVVIAIVGVLAAVVLVAINPARRLAQARDSGRKSDIGQIATAAQAFFTTNPNGSYPNALADLVPGDLKQLPTQPGGAAYSYATRPAVCDENNAASPCQEAAIFANLEASGLSGQADTTTMWCFRTATGVASEVLRTAGCAA